MLNLLQTSLIIIVLLRKRVFISIENSFHLNLRYKVMKFVIKMHLHNKDLMKMTNTMGETSFEFHFKRILEDGVSSRAMVEEMFVRK